MGNGAGLNERRQQGELGSTQARAPHRFFKRARQLPAPPARGGADALPGGDEVNFSGIHIRCMHTFIEAVKAYERADN